MAAGHCRAPDGSTTPAGIFAFLIGGGLEAAAYECYQVVKAEFDRLLRLSGSAALGLCRPGLERATQKISKLVEVVEADHINVGAEVDFRSPGVSLDAEDDDRHTMSKLRSLPDAARGLTGRGDG